MQSWLAVCQVVKLLLAHVPWPSGSFQETLVLLLPPDVSHDFHLDEACYLCKRSACHTHGKPSLKTRFLRCSTTPFVKGSLKANPQASPEAWLCFLSLKTSKTSAWDLHLGLIDGHHYTECGVPAQKVYHASLLEEWEESPDYWSYYIHLERLVSHQQENISATLSVVNKALLSTVRTHFESLGMWIFQMYSPLPGIKSIRNSMVHLGVQSLEDNMVKWDSNPAELWPYKKRRGVS